VCTAALVIAPVLLLASTIAYVANGEGMNDGELAGAVQVWASIGFALGIVGLTRRFERAAPRASAWLLVAGLCGAAASVAYGIDSIQVAMFGTESIQDTDSAVGPLALQLPGILFPLALCGIGVMLARTRTAPAIAAVALAVGAVLFPIARIPDLEAVALVGDGVLLIALGAIVWSASTSSARLQPRRDAQMSPTAR
jgi:hypothetical protein